MHAKTMKMKLLIDRKTKRLLFAEAGKDVVDFLFSLLALPLGTITKLLTTENMVGSIGCIYQSMEDLDINYFQKGVKDYQNKLLNPAVPLFHLKSTYLFATNRVGPPCSYYLCSNGDTCLNKCRGFVYFTDACNAKCPGCEREMSRELKFTYQDDSIGLVKDMVTYVVMDDLTIMPVPGGVSSIKMLHKLNVKDLAKLEERTVMIGLEEGLKMVKVSLQSKTVLTDVFLQVKAETR